MFVKLMAMVSLGFLALNVFSQSYLVSGAGTADANGVYVYAGEYNGYPYYQNADYYIGYVDGFMTSGWGIFSGGGEFFWYWNDPDYYTDVAGDLPPSTGWNTFMGSSPVPTVGLAGPTVSYSGNIFRESLSDDGTIPQTVSISLFSETFTGSSGVFDSSKYTASNVPEGLSLVLTKNSSNEMTMAFSGAAVEHVTVNTATNVGISFLDAAFTSGDASEVMSSSKDDFEVIFRCNTEFLVNTCTNENQQYPAVVGLNDGRFVVVWTSTTNYNSDIEGQLFDEDGDKIGSEFRVNTYTAGHQNYPEIAALTNGGFVVAWNSYGQDGSSEGVYGQRYDSSASKDGIEFRINDYTTSSQSYPSLAGLPNGGFVVTFGSYDQIDGWDIYCKLYNADGTVAVSDFLVNTYTTGNQNISKVATFSDGSFVITWSSYNQEVSGYSVRAQRYDSSATKVGSEFRVNTYNTSYQYRSEVASFSNDAFVIVWQSYDQDGSWGGIYGQRYTSAGVADGSEFKINTYTDDYQQWPKVDVLEDDSFVVAWESNGQDASGYGVFGQRYNSSGSALGGEFQINTYTDDDQDDLDIAGLSEGGFVLSWVSQSQDGDGLGVYAGLSGPCFARAPSTSVETNRTSSMDIGIIIRACSTFGNIDNMTWSVVSGPSHGTITGLPYVHAGEMSLITPSSVTYQPDAGYFGTDSFTIKVDDGYRTDELIINLNIIKNGTIIIL